MENTYSTEELKHYGVKGMKWGVRRKPGPDGTVSGNGKKIETEKYDSSEKGIKKILAKVSGQSIDKVSGNDYASFAWDSEGTDELHWNEPLSAKNPKDVKRIGAELKEFWDRACDRNDPYNGHEYESEESFEEARRYRDTYLKDPEAYAKIVIEDINYWRAQRGQTELLEHSGYSTEELQHWGIKGQKWGIRRYQNKDGSLTPAGLKRYNKEMEKLKKDQAKLKEEQRIQKNRQKTQAKIDKLKEAQDKLEADKKALAAEKKGLKNGKKNDQPDETPEQRKERLLKSTDAKELYKHKDELSYNEMNERINRIDLENKLQSRIVEEQRQTGRERVNSWMKNTSEVIENTTNLYKKVDNAYSTVANSAIGKTLAKKLGMEPPKKEWDWADFWQNRNKKTDKELSDASKRATAEKIIENELKRRYKEESEGRAAAEETAKQKTQKEAQEQVNDYNRQREREAAMDGGAYKSRSDEVFDTVYDDVSDSYVTDIPSDRRNTGRNAVTALLEEMS